LDLAEDPVAFGPVVALAWRVGGAVVGCLRGGLRIGREALAEVCEAEEIGDGLELGGELCGAVGVEGIVGGGGGGESGLEIFGGLGGGGGDVDVGLEAEGIADGGRCRDWANRRVAGRRDFRGRL
jgi:hypothetical protein